MNQKEQWTGLVESSDRKLYSWVRWALWAGLIGSFVLFVTGFAWLGFSDGPTDGAVTFGDILPSLKAGDLAALVSLGILTLLLTPVAALALSTLAFSLRKEPLYVGISLAVIAILTLGILLGML